ncbi:TPA: chitin synthase [Patescibacteria group bacterium]|nr:MAG: Glycosyl transferase family 2 [Parcubacteria group bacterium GW2011_GWD2_42_14]HCC04738.1 chitin synthase [Patescibacteria group bacterium]
MNIQNLFKTKNFTQVYQMNKLWNGDVITTIKEPKHKKNKANINDIKTGGIWLAFFIIIYFILFIKVLTFETVFNNAFFGFYSILITVYILSRFLLAYFHKETPYDPSYEPTVTFVVPAKNEEDNIAETIRRFGNVNYPLDKIEVVAINDGSTDGTYTEMVKVANELRSKIKTVKVINWKVNKGKRHGMAEGVKQASHDIIIFIDSDSFIEPNCVRHLVKYFASDSVGAVSGHTDVYNRETNLLTQMQALRYYIAFKIYKSAESVFGSVTCCPGCCSAYRRKYLVEIVDEWLVQRFLGAECTFGDDRSLTNYIIRNYDAVYSHEALAYTVVPDNFKVYVRQQFRWKKSWIRETLIASVFMWRRHPLAAASYYLYIFLALTSPIVFFRAIAWYPAVHQVWPVIYLFGLFLMLLLHGLYYRAKVGPRAWALAVFSFWFNSVILIWQLPWAAINIRDSRWGTR